MVKDIFKGYKREFINKGDHYLVKHWREGETKPQFIETITKEQYKELIDRHNSPKHKLMMKGARKFAEIALSGIETNPGIDDSMVDLLAYASQIDTHIDLIITSPWFKSLAVDKQLEFLDIQIGMAKERQHHMFYKKDRDKYRQIEATLKNIRDGIDREKSRDVEEDDFINRLREYGFFELPQIESLTDKKQYHLLKKLRSSDKTYTTAFLYHITIAFSDHMDFFSIMKEKLNLKTKKAVIEKTAGVLDSTFDTIEGYFKNIKNKKKTFKDKITKELIREDYNKIRAIWEKRG